MTDNQNQKARVLVVDDSKPIRVYLRRILTDLHADVVAEGGNGNEAVACFKSTSPDLTLLDINMPMMDGRAALKEILKVQPEARVVMLTSINDGSIVAECIDGGAINYLLKDMSKEELIAELKSVLEAVAK